MMVGRGPTERRRSAHRCRHVHPPLCRTIAVAAAALAVYAAPAFSSARATTQPASAPTVDEWPMFRGDRHLTGVAAGRLPPSLAVRWRHVCPEAVASTAAIVGETVYVGCDDAHLYALNLADGRVRWTYAAKDAIRSSPTVLRLSGPTNRTVVCFGDEDGTVHAIDARRGTAVWTYQTDGPVISSPNVDRGRIIVGSYDGTLYCLDARTGKLVWQYETEDRIHGTPCVAGGVALTAGCDARLHVVRLSDGKAMRTVDMDAVSGSAAAVRGSQVFVGTYGGRVLAIDFNVGKVAWWFEDTARQFPFLSSAAITETTVFISGRDKRLHALDLKTGRQRWEFASRGRMESSPVVVGDRVFIASYDGNLYAVDIASGRQRWRFETGAPITASPAVARGRLVIGTEDGVIYCFGSP